MKYRAMIIGGVCVVGAVLCALLFFYPADQYNFWPKCIFFQVTGLHCPGCGNTRALSALLHGNIGESLRHNILLMPAFGVLIALAVRPRLAYNRIFVWSIAGVIMIFFLLRNLPWQPFAALAP